VHAGVRRALGTQAAQAGSLNAPGRLRFDFTSPGGAVPPSVLADVEDEVNDVLLHDYDVRAEITTLDEARKAGAIAFFGEKYGDKVRVITIGDYSKELCGGTHVHRSGEIGVVKLLSEASIGAGVRRVEALVGLDAFRFLAREHVLVAQLAEQFKAKPEELPERIGAVVEKLRTAEKELERLRGAQLLSSAGTLAEQAEDVNGTALVALATPDGVAGNDLRTLAGEVRNRLGARPGVVALFSADGAKVSFVVATTGAARDRGLAAGALVPAFAPAIGGRGGGKPDLAQGGGTNPAGVEEAVRLLRNALAV
jgi:alanyl-tRNA synthetase